MSQQMIIEIYGMHCKNCVAKVDSNLRTIPGVQDIVVELDRSQALVTGTASRVDLEDKVRELGYDTIKPSEAESSESNSEEVSSGASKDDDEQSVFLAITGMSCASCVATVEKALQTSPGVSHASVNYADASAFVRTSKDLPALVEAVTAAGYGARIVEEEEDFDAEGQHLDSDFRRALLKSTVALALGALFMADMWLGILPMQYHSGIWVAMGIVTLVIMIVTGGHFFRGAWTAARHLTTTMDTLIALGTGTAWLYSMLVILLPGLLPVEARHLYLEAAVFIIGFINLGKALEHRARGKTSLAIRKLIDLAPKTAMKLVDGNATEVAVAELVKGDSIRIRPGETLPVDGVVTGGASELDEAMLTGEPVPREVTVGDVVSAGTMNLQGSLVLEVQSVGKDTVLSRMVQLVREAQNTKPAIGHTVDQIAAVFVPLVMLVAAITVVVWLMYGPEPAISLALVTGMSVLIVACPCALGLAIPMSIMVGMGRAASAGMLIRNSDALQAASELDCLVLDKTGTITEGKPGVVTVKSEAEAELLLKVAMSLEALSEHPLAEAIVAYCNGKNIQPLAVESFNISPGGGVKGQVAGKQTVLGNAAYVQGEVDSLQLSSVDCDGTVIYVTHGGEYLGYLELVDTAKPSSADGISELKALGMEVIMLTGDGERTAKFIAGQVGIDQWQAAMQPEDKLAYLKRLQSQGKRVGMVGDGINDAPALSQANVGFAMGAGSDIALESADVVLLNDDLASVARSIRLSRKVMNNIRLNLVGAFAYNLALIPVAAGVLYPATGLLINPSFAGFAMAASSLTVVFNASLLRRVKLSA